MFDDVLANADRWALVPRSVCSGTVAVMSRDTKTLLVTMTASVAGSAVAVIAVVLTLVGGVRADLRDVRTDLRDVRADVRTVHERLDRFDDRLRAVEIAFGKVDQRLLTIERVVLPARDPAD